MKICWVKGFKKKIARRHLKATNCFYRQFLDLKNAYTALNSSLYSDLGFDRADLANVSLATFLIETESQNT